MCGEHFEFMKLKFLQNALIRGIFTHTPPHSKLTPNFLSSSPRQKDITHSPRQHCFKNLFPGTAERGKENWFYLLKFSQKIWKRGQNCSKRKKRHIVRIHLLVENRLHGEFYRPNVFHYRFKIQWLTWTSHCRCKNLRPASKSLKNDKFGF